MHSPVEKNNRRISPDRRRKPTPVISKYTLAGGRRKTIRRQKDKDKYMFVDLYDGRIGVIVLFLITLALIDAYFTIALIGKGMAKEANPIMAFYLGYGHRSFIAVKFLMTAVSLFLLYLCNRYFITKLSLASAVIIYTLIIIHQLNISYKFYPYLIRFMAQQ